jgi:hypothetical protein
MRPQALRLSLVVLFLLGLALPASARAQDLSTNEPLRAATPASTDPLAARFGGTRTSFEQTYGEPAKADAGDYPRGDDYRIDGYKRVSAFYDANRVVHLTLTAPTSDFWTTAQADDAVAAFLPTDAKLGKPVKTADEEPLIHATSKTLAKQVDQDAYDTYQAKGKPGDLSITYQLDKRKRVKAIDVELGRVASSSQNDANAEKIYLKALRQQYDTLTASMGQFDQTLQGMNNGTIDNQTAVQTLFGIWVTWRQADADAKGLKPPASQQDTQNLYVQLTGLLAGAADDFQNGLLNGDNSLLQSGNDKYKQAVILVVLVGSTLSAAGV